MITCEGGFETATGSGKQQKLARFISNLRDFY